MANKKEVKNEIDIEQIEIEIKNNIREELYDEITNKIDVESKKTLDRMEKRIIKYKNSSIRKRNFIIFILLLVIIVETYIILENHYSIKINNSNKEIKEQIKVSSKEEKDENWYIEKYSYLMNNIKTNLLEDKYYLYKDNYTEKSINNKVRLNMAYQLLEEKRINDDIIKIKVNDLENAYKKIFGNLDNYKNETFSSECIQFVYDNELNIYMGINTECEIDNKSILEEIKTIYEEDGNIVIETIVGIYDKEKEELLNISLEKITDKYNDNLIEYEKDLDKRKYIFKEIENEYYLKEVKSNN